MSKKGFALIELLAVCLIIAVLSGIALPNYRRSVERARVGEALTMLRSVYDSCERLAWENQQSNCGIGVKNGVVNFRKLDILAKGTYSNSAKTLSTENFTYTLDYKESGGAISTLLTAVCIRGPYAGGKITFNGQSFTCTAGASGTPANACKVWGSAAWNE